MPLSIIIINYKTPSMTVKCIEAVENAANKALQYEVIVVDNNSQDNSREMITNVFPHVRWIQNQTNEGFGRANNLGIQAARGKYLLFLNSDVFVEDGCINASLNRLKTNPHIGVLGCRLKNEDGSSQKSVYYHDVDYMGILENNLLYSKLVKKNRKNEIKAVMGSFMLIPSAVIKKVGGFDPDFFMYSEEIELCYRIRKVGYKVDYFPDASATHLHGASSNQSDALRQNFLSNSLLFLKTRGYSGYAMFHFLMHINMISNFLAMWFIKNFKSYRKQYYARQIDYLSNYKAYLTMPFRYKRGKYGDRPLRRAKK